MKNTLKTYLMGLALVVTASSAFGAEVGRPRSESDDFALALALSESDAMAKAKPKADTAEEQALARALKESLAEQAREKQKKDDAQKAMAILKDAIEKDDIQKVKRWLPLVDMNTFFNSRGETPLHMARSTKMALILLQQKANVNAINSYGDTPLHTYLRHSSEKPELAATLTAELLCAGADPYIENKEGETVPRSIDIWWKAEYSSPKNYLKTQAGPIIATCMLLRTEGLHQALLPYLNKNTAGMVIDYTWDKFEQEARDHVKALELSRS